LNELQAVAGAKIQTDDYRYFTDRANAFFSGSTHHEVQVEFVAVEGDPETNWYFEQYGECVMVISAAFGRVCFGSWKI
jgi:hypothetical protein